MKRLYPDRRLGIALTSAAGAAQAQQSTSFELNGQAPLTGTVEHDCGAPDRCTGIDLSQPVSSMTTASVSLVCNGQGGTRTIEFASANGSKLKGDETGLEIPCLGKVSGSGNAQALPMLVNNWPINGTQSRSFAISPNLNPYTPPADEFRDTVTVSILP